MKLSFLFLLVLLLTGCQAAGTSQITLNINPYSLEDTSMQITVGP